MTKRSQRPLWKAEKAGAWRSAPSAGPHYFTVTLAEDQASKA